MIGGSLGKIIIPIPLDERTSREEYYEMVNKEIDDSEIIFFTDIPGGTPDIVAKMIVMKREKGFVISGVNLPMLINLMHENEFDDLEKFADKLIISGKNGIQKFYNQD